MSPQAAWPSRLQGQGGAEHESLDDRNKINKAELRHHIGISASTLATMLAPLDDPSVRLQAGPRTDDMVVEALFAQRNAKGRHYGPQRWFRPGQTALSTQQDISTFVEAQEAWVKTEIGVGRAYAEATKWYDLAQFVGAYAALFASWSAVSIRAVSIAGVGPRQFAIIAEEELPQQTTIHELTGLLSSDPSDGASHSNLSLMQDLDVVPRVLFGPSRLVNHCCALNARASVTVRTNNKIIRRQEEITVSYGPGFWTEDNPCLCSVCLGPGLFQVGNRTWSRRRRMKRDETQDAIAKLKRASEEVKEGRKEGRKEEA
ncbi:hypothetical protein B0H13DRAFT_1927176 [Mycena leptocephala]|nr:hypothetical protein B0H13DRAFT_1927176 [Mycena leptocephala]